MDCGADDLSCLLLDWVFTNSYIIRQPLEYVAILWDRAGGTITEFFKEHGEKVIAIASFSFAVSRWWYFREQTLHKRLEEYIQESDERLGPASTAAIDAILRPGRAAVLPQPAFAVELNRLLARQNWQSATRYVRARPRAEQRLAQAMKGILKRERIAEAAVTSLQQQRAQAHILRGIAWASRARKCSDLKEARKLHHRALREFQIVQNLPGQRRNSAAKEGEAYQLLRLGERGKAFRAYDELERFASDEPDKRTRELLIARAKRYRAQVRLANGRPGLAWNLVARDGDPSTAINLRRGHGPYREWEGIEQAETHYAAARIARSLNFNNEEPEHLAEAERNYKSVLEETGRPWLLRARLQALREEAMAGLDRVERAKSGDYDDRWLMLT